METTGESEVTFGQYKNYVFKEVPEYLEWAINEWRTAGQCSPYLARLARWADSQKSLGASSQGYGAKYSKDPADDFSMMSSVDGGGDPRVAGTFEDPAHSQDGRGHSKDRSAKGQKSRESVRAAMAAKRAKRDARADRGGESASESYKDVNVSGGDSEPEGVVSFGSRFQNDCV